MTFDRISRRDVTPGIVREVPPKASTGDEEAEGEEAVDDRSWLDIDQQEPVQLEWNMGKVNETLEFESFSDPLWVGREDARCFFLSNKVE